MVLTSALRRAAQVNGEGAALVADGRPITWRTLCDRVSRIAGGLGAAGIKAGDRVCVLSHNRPEFLEIQYATSWAGGVLVPLNFRFAVAEICHSIKMTGSRLLVADAFFADVVGAVAREVQGLRVIWIGGNAELGGPHYEMLASASPIEDSSLGNDQLLAGIFFTGGTTGLPRGVGLTLQNIRVHLLEMRHALEYERRSVYAHIMPMFHLAGFGMGHALTLATGTHCFLDQFSAARCLRLIADQGVTHLSIVPTMLAAILDELEAARGPGSAAAVDALKSVEMIAYGAAPIPVVLLERLLQLLPEVRLRQFYGMTELSGACVTLGPEHHGLDARSLDRMSCAGRVMSTSEAKTVRTDGSDCAPDEPGEILVRGPQVMHGYWNDPEATAQAVKNGWMHTGDVGSIDQDGFIRIRDRSKDMIVSGGENVFSIEVEGAIASHARVLQIAIIGLPDSRWGERVHAVVVIKPDDATDGLQAELEEHCRGRIANYKIPKSWTFSSKPLPLSGVGKVQKQKLKAEVLDHAT
jgi:long-chain acyl-CoA synthetase